MKLIIAGCRYFKDTEYVLEALRSSPFSHPSEIISGAAQGVDTCGEEIAKRLKIPVKRFPADWRAQGRRAGPLRNQEMAEYADALLAIWDGKSLGTGDMIMRMEKLGKRVFTRYISN